MTDKSFGDYTNRNIVKNPLLSTAVTGLSLEDIAHNAVLLPVLPNQGLISSQDCIQSGAQDATSSNATERNFMSLQSGDGNANTQKTNVDLNITPPFSNIHAIAGSHNTDNVPTNQSKASAKSNDDFDVNEYFARLQGTRYVSAPLNCPLKDDLKSQAATDESLEEINLNDNQSTGENTQSLTADIAQNFSQLPQVLPQVASAVFSSFSSMLSFKSRDQTPEFDAVKQVRDNSGFKEVQFDCSQTYPQTTYNPSGHDSVSVYGAEPIVTNVPPPLKEPPKLSSTSNTFRLTAKRKTYAPIPGLNTRGGTSSNLQAPIIDPIAPKGTSFLDSPQITNVNLAANEREINSSVDIDFSAYDTKAQIPTPQLFNPTVQYSANNTAQYTPVLNELEQSDTIKMYQPPQSQSVGPTQTESLFQAQSIPMNTLSHQPLQGPPVGTQPTVPIIPPPPMFSNLPPRNSITTPATVSRTILPPSIARRLTNNPSSAQCSTVQQTAENVLVPSFEEIQDNQIAKEMPSSFSSNLGVSVQETGSALPTSNVASDFLSQPTLLNPSLFNVSTNAERAMVPTTHQSPQENGVNLIPEPPKVLTGDQITLPESDKNIDTLIQPLFFDPSAFKSNMASEHDSALMSVDKQSAYQNVAPEINTIQPPVSQIAKTIPDPPKMVTGSQNFRLKKKRPQYYSGPIDGIGDMVNKVKPVLPPVEQPGNNYNHQVPPPQEMTPEFMTIQNAAQPLTALEQHAPVFDITRSEINIHQESYPGGVSMPAVLQNEGHSIQQNYAPFDMSRPALDNYDDPTSDPKGFGLIGSLKSKLSSININKIQNSVTTFFDPGYNNEKSREESAAYPQYDQSYSKENFEIFVPGNEHTSKQMTATPYFDMPKDTSENQYYINDSNIAPNPTQAFIPEVYGNDAVQYTLYPSSELAPASYFTSDSKNIDSSINILNPSNKDVIDNAGYTDCTVPHSDATVDKGSSSITLAQTSTSKNEPKQDFKIDDMKSGEKLSSGAIGNVDIPIHASDYQYSFNISNIAPKPNQAFISNVYEKDDVQYTMYPSSEPAPTSYFTSDSMNINVLNPSNKDLIDNVSYTEYTIPRSDATVEKGSSSITLAQTSTSKNESRQDFKIDDQKSNDQVSSGAIGNVDIPKHASDYQYSLNSRNIVPNPDQAFISNVYEKDTVQYTMYPSSEPAPSFYFTSDSKNIDSSINVLNPSNKDFIANISNISSKTEYTKPHSDATVDKGSATSILEQTSTSKNEQDLKIDDMKSDDQLSAGAKGSVVKKVDTNEPINYKSVLTLEKDINNESDKPPVNLFHLLTEEVMKSAELNFPQPDYSKTDNSCFFDDYKSQPKSAIFSGIARTTEEEEIDVVTIPIGKIFEKEKGAEGSRVEHFHVEDTKVSDLNICETCREVNKSEDKVADDLTTQLIENITAPIQLINPIDVPLSEMQNTMKSIIDPNQLGEISYFAPDSVSNDEIYSSLTKNNQFHNYGWCPDNVSIGSNICLESGIALLPINDIGFLDKSSLFYSNTLIPTNASDEIKAELNIVHDNVIHPPASFPTVPLSEDLDENKSDPGVLDVQSIEEDAKEDFLASEEYVIEPSETDDDKIEYRERERSSEDPVPEIDTFTNRVERYKKFEETLSDVHALTFPEVTSPITTLASYFDTGNYAAETHYRNSLTSPPANLSLFASNHNMSNLGQSLFSTIIQNDHATTNYPESASVFTIINNDQTSDDGVQYDGKQHWKDGVESIDPNGHLDEKEARDQQFQEWTPHDVEYEKADEDLHDKETEASYRNPLDIDSSSADTPKSKETEYQDSVGVVLPVDAFNVAPLKETLPDPINFFSSSAVPDVPLQEKDDGSESSFNRLASYFSSPTKTKDHSKSFFELSQSQKHFRRNTNNTLDPNNSFNVNELAGGDKTEGISNPRVDLSCNQNNTKVVTNITDDRYVANLQLMKDLTSYDNFAPSQESVVTTVNYFGVEYQNMVMLERITDNVVREADTKADLVNLYGGSSKSCGRREESSVDAAGEINDQAIVSNCARCCNLESETVIVVDECLGKLSTDRVKVRQNMNTEAHSSGVAETEGNVDSVADHTNKQQSVSFEDTLGDIDGPPVAADDNRMDTEYVPVKHHWFYRHDFEDKSIWRGFSLSDSKALEDAFNSPDLNESSLVATDGGRYDVNVVGRLRTPVYWSDKPTNVRRCSWFYKGATDARYVPYTETVAEKLEEEYRHGLATGVWHRRLILPNNDAVVMHGPAVMVHFVQASTSDSWGGSALFGKRVYRNPPKINVLQDQDQKIDHLLMLVHGAGEWRMQRQKLQSTIRPKVVRRGYDEVEIEDTEPSSIDHLLLLCHGVGSACDMRFRAVEEVVDDFRATSLQLVQSHYKNSCDTGVVGRVEVLPISWHSTLHSGESGVDKRLSQITLESIPKLRNFTNDTVLDVLFYTSPIFCQTIVNTVCGELNRIYALFKQRNPKFSGGVSLGGHSLGSVILYDILCHQIESMSKCCSSKTFVQGPVANGPTCVKYPLLQFKPESLYALGSPIAIFECIRGVEMLGENFCLPTCGAFFNIFHPYDPIAYRIEPLINPELKNVPPFLIPHHKGRKRMHLELKDTMARVGADIKQKIVESLKATWSSMWRSQPPTSEQLEKVLEEELDSEDLIAHKDQPSPDIDVSTTKLLGRLNSGRRIDHVLQEAPFEMINEYLFAMTSHVCYWESEDTMLLILREIYSTVGVQPDSTVPQQTLSVQRTRIAGEDEDVAPQQISEIPSTSRTGNKS